MSTGRWRVWVAGCVLLGLAPVAAILGIWADGRFWLTMVVLLVAGFGATVSTTEAYGKIPERPFPKAERRRLRMQAEIERMERFTGEHR